MRRSRITRSIYVFRLSLVRVSRNVFLGYSPLLSAHRVASADSQSGPQQRSSSHGSAKCQSAAAVRRICNPITYGDLNERTQCNERTLPMTANEISPVSGGILEKEGLYPRKFGDVDYLVYVDGVLIGTTYGPPASASSDVGSGRPIDPISNGRIQRPFGV